MLVLPASLTHADASACLRLLLAALAAERQGPALVDAGALTRFDSSALALLLEIRRVALADGRGFAVKALPAALARLAQLYGVQGLLPEAPACAPPLP